MTTTETKLGAVMLSYDVFVNDPPPQDGVLPNGEPKLFSPMDRRRRLALTAVIS
jgi:hypothetical protein